MTTLSALKATIADDLARSDLTTQIAAEISNAITFYKSTRFWFNETRTATFPTVAAQTSYSSSDDADIPLFLKIDEMFVEDSDGQNYVVERTDPTEMERLLYTGSSSGRPFLYAYLNGSFRLFPIPDAAYTMRPVGHIEVAAPATDGEANNPWMVYAYELLRCRAKAYLYLHVIQAPDKAALMQEAERQALAELASRTTGRVASGRITPTVF